MAGNIKGITIEFRGDTTKLDKALRQINKETKDIDKELKDVNKALKFNPRNIELWKQKQQLLTQKVNETKEKLNLLKDAQKKMDASGVDKNSQEYRELQREIITTESKLKNFKNQLREVGNVRLKVLSESLKDVGDKMVNVGKGLTTHVTAPIVGIGAAAVQSFNEVQEGLKIVAQKTGATGDELAAMEETVRNLAKELPTDFSTAGTAVGELNTRFGVTGQELEKLSEDYIKFARVNGVDLNNSIDQTQKALSAFGLSAEDAPALLDRLTLAGQQSGASVDTLTNGLIQNGAAFQEMGLNIDQSVNYMAQIEKSGVNSEAAMSGLRRALKNAAAEGKPLDQALEELQDTIQNGTGDMDGLTASYDLFGKSGDQIYNAVKNGSLDFRELSASAGDASGTLEQAFQQSLTPADQWQMTMNALKDTGYEIGNTIMEYLQPAMEKLNEKIQAFSEWWSKLSPETKDMILKIAAIAAAVGPVVLILGKLATGIGAIISLVTTVAPMMAGLAGPIGIAIAAVAALIAIGVALYKNWDKIKAVAGKLKDWVVNKFTALKTAVSNIFNGIKDKMLAPIQKARDMIKKIIEKIKGFFNFKAKIPKIKLPHFAIHPKGWKLSDLLEGVIPSLGIDWYAQGGIFKSPRVIGVGEAGPEAVLPIEKLNGMMMAMADSIVNGVSTSMALQGAGGAGTITIPIYLYPNGPKMGEETVKMYDKYKRILG